jgi:hypothetical protein
MTSAEPPIQGRCGMTSAMPRYKGGQHDQRKARMTWLYLLVLPSA